jgi:hypothetical protein
LHNAAFATDRAACANGHQRRGEFHQARAQRQPSVPCNHHLEQVRRGLRTNKLQSKKENQPGKQPPQRRRDNASPGIHYFRDLHRIARLVQEKLLHQFHRIVKEKVHQSAQHSHPAGQEQVEGLLAEPGSFADAQQPPPVVAEETVQLADESVIRRKPHTPIFTQRGRFDERQFHPARQKAHQGTAVKMWPRPSRLTSRAAGAGRRPAATVAMARGAPPNCVAKRACVRQTACQ